jgi:flap endonuclease-1
LFKNIPLEKGYLIEWKEPDKEKVINLLVNEHDFAMERVKTVLDNLLKNKESKQQKGLGEFF